ncbi:hypothetical protein [Mycobacterium sp.]|uniref:hypothetical protein n=1 Tax=Mycobacterium sp. TaxID=1785 RepID=UPI0031D3D239
MAYQLSSLDIWVLVLLRAHPMDGYELFQPLVERHAEPMVQIRPGSQCYVVDRPTGTARDGRRPERKQPNEVAI